SVRSVGALVAGRASAHTPTIIHRMLNSTFVDFPLSSQRHVTQGHPPVSGCERGSQEVEGGRGDAVPVGPGVVPGAVASGSGRFGERVLEAPHAGVEVVFPTAPQ